MPRSLVRWDPAREMMSLRDAMDRMWRESFFRPLLSREPFFDIEAPPLDMHETASEVVIEATVPGVKPEDINVQVTGNVLTIKGERKEEKEEKEATYIYREQSFGSFSRSVTLPTEVDVDKAKATFEHGVLTLSLPKSKAVQPKKIEVEAK
jgi:HSP20 family protein